MKTTSKYSYNYAINTDHRKAVIAAVGLWASYYRANIHRFIQDYLHVQLKLFQVILVLMMQEASTIVLIAARGIGKTFIGALYLVARCILYPGTKVCIASGTRGQAMTVIEKIMTEIKINSPELCNEIDEDETRINGNNCILSFKNGSFIKVVTAADSSRSNRANILFIDEFRMVKQDVITTILRKFIAGPRHPGYLDLPKYKNDPLLQERNKIIYSSSAFYEDHWSYQRCKDTFRLMINPAYKAFVCAFPYQLAIQEGLLLEEEVKEQMLEADFNVVKWLMEMDALFYGSGDDAFFNYEIVAKNRHLDYAMLPGNLSAKLPKCTEFRIPAKGVGEKRVLSVDIALMASTKHQNDATAIFLNQMVPTKAGRYTYNICYGENNEGMRTEAEALRIRRLYEWFDCDYLVLDVRNVGLSIFDLLAADMNDPDTGEVYPALSCCNNDAMAARCVVPGAKKVIWAISGSAKFNSEAALMLREGFRSGKLRLLIPDEDFDMLMADKPGFSSLSIQDKLALKMPYINTTLLISELINLQHDDSGGLVRIYEKTGYRKDRYSSLSYNFWVAGEIEKEAQRKGLRAISKAEEHFIFRAPKSKERW